MREVLLLCWRDTEHPQGGGSEVYLTRVGEYLAQQGVRVTLRTATYPGAEKRETRNGVTISRGGGRFSVYPLALIAIVLSRFGLGPLRGIKPDVIIDTQNGVPFFARLVSPAPVVVLTHHCHREQWPVAGTLVGRLGWWIESKLAPRVHRRNQYLTVSLPSAEELSALGVDPAQIAVVRNGCDPLPEVSASRSETPRLVVLSRLVPHKHIEDAISAVAVLAAKFPDVQLDVIGDGWWADELYAFAAEAKVAGRVRFHGHLSDVHKHDVLAQAWVHVMPSRKEGWGLAVIEAAQHGVPTVGYRMSAGLLDSVVDGVTGVLTDDVESLTEVLAELLTDREYRESMGAKALARSAEFSWEKCAAGVMAVLQSAIAGELTAGVASQAQ